MKENNLFTKPHLIHNSDETAIFLNKSSQHIIVPTKSKYARILARGNSEHITMVSCISAGGTAIPPLIVFSGTLPCLRALEKDGPTNATYAATKSGFVDQGLYFLRYAHVERPLLLLQDGASAHISAELIDCAIENNVILMCFPPNMTFVLQPCDVGMFHTLKCELSKVLHQVKLLRSDLWVSKPKFPAIFKPVYEKTFNPHLIATAFRKCGISKNYLQIRANPGR